MKKTAYASLIGVLLGFLTPAAAYGLTPPPPTDDYGTGTPESSIYCPQLSATIQKGARGEQVSELQAFLTSYYDLDENIVVGGYFGNLTHKYVVQFQTEQGLPAFGIVGTLTRAKIASVCGGATAGIPSCTITADKSSYTLGQTAVFTWTSKNATYAAFVPDTSGKDNLAVPGHKLPASGSQPIAVNVSGNPFVTLAVYGSNGASARCMKTISVTAAPSSCMHAGVTLAHGESRQFYSKSIAPVGSHCSFHVRHLTCSNGALPDAASYPHASCNGVVQCPSTAIAIPQPGADLVVSSAKVPAGCSVGVAWNGGETAHQCYVYKTDSTATDYLVWDAQRASVTIKINSHTVFTLRCIDSTGGYVYATPRYVAVAIDGVQSAAGASSDVAVSPDLKESPNTQSLANALTALEAMLKGLKSMFAD